MSSEESDRRFSSGFALRVGALSLFTGFGLFIAGAVVWDWLQAVDTYSWDPATCTIESAEVADEEFDVGYQFNVTYRYSYRDQELVGDAYSRDGASFDHVADAERLAARYEPGTAVPCWVDPDDPTRAYLVQANLWKGLWILAPLLFVGIGAGALWFVFRLREASRGGVAASRPFPFRILLWILFGAFFLFGLGFLIPFFVQPALEVLDARSWRPVPCEILSSRVATHQSTGSDGPSSTYSVDVFYRYEIDGREHRSNRYQFLGGSSGDQSSKQEAVAAIPEGAEVTCWVNPEDPFDAVIERGFTSDYLFGFIPLIFALVGLGGLIFTWWGTRVVAEGASGSGWRAAETMDGGRTGPIDLEPKAGPWGKLGCTILIALGWNGFISLFVWQVVKEARAGNVEWFPILILTPFVLIGLLFLAGIPYSILALANPRPRLKLSRGAIPAGDSVQISWSFEGWPSRLRGLRIWLECNRTTTETTVHEGGASMKSSTDVVDTLEILERGRDEPLASGSVSFTVPEAAVPTSDGDDESFSWKLKLQGEIAFWPDVIEEYEVSVLPAQD